MPLELRSRVRPDTSVPSDFRTLTGACTGKRRPERLSDPWVAIGLLRQCTSSYDRIGSWINVLPLVQAAEPLCLALRSLLAPAPGWAHWWSATAQPWPGSCQSSRFPCTPSPAKPAFQGCPGLLPAPEQLP